MTAALMRPPGAHPFLYLDAAGEWGLVCETCYRVIPHEGPGVVTCECDAEIVVPEAEESLRSLRFGTFGPPSDKAEDWLMPAAVLRGFNTDRVLYEDLCDLGYKDARRACQMIEGALAICRVNPADSGCFPFEHDRGHCYHPNFGHYYRGLYTMPQDVGYAADCARSLAEENRTRYLAHLFLTQPDRYAEGLEDGAKDQASMRKILVQAAIDSAAPIAIRIAERLFRGKRS